MRIIGTNPLRGSKMNLANDTILPSPDARLKSGIGIPCHLLISFAVVEVACESEKEVAQAVDEHNQHRVDRSFVGEVEDAAFAAACNGTAHVGKSRKASAARQHKAPQGRQGVGEAVDLSLNQLHIGSRESAARSVASA